MPRSTSSKRRRESEKRRHRHSKFLARRSAEREPRARVLIVCEGKETEPRYFTALREDKRLATVEVEGSGREYGSHPSSVVAYAVDRMEEEKRDGDGFDIVWCVFDCDKHERIHEAFTRARDLGIKVAFSNPCFELWFLLHFIGYSTAHIERDAAASKLKHDHIPGYEKTTDVYASLLDAQKKAITNAKKLRKYHAGANEGRAENPSTTVDVLVVQLNELAER